VSSSVDTGSVCSESRVATHLENLQTSVNLKVVREKSENTLRESESGQGEVGKYVKGI